MVVKLGWVKFIQRFALTDCVSVRVQSRLATEPDRHWPISGRKQAKKELSEISIMAELHQKKQKRRRKVVVVVVVSQSTHWDLD